MKKTINKGLVFLALVLLSFSCKENTEDYQFSEQTTHVSDATNLDIYFSKNPDEAKNQELLETTIEAYLIRDKEDKKVYSVQPIYAYGVEGVAYYELVLTADGAVPSGWVMISVTDKDVPVLSHSDGSPQTANFTLTDAKQDKVYRFGPSYFTHEKNGVLVAEYGEMPNMVLISNGTEMNGGAEFSDENTPDESGMRIASPSADLTLEVNSYKDLKELFPASYFTDERAQWASEDRAKLALLNQGGDGSRVAASTPNWSYDFVGGNWCEFTQIDAHTSVNNKDCASGCANNAWLNMYGHWDIYPGMDELLPTTALGNTTYSNRLTDDVKAACDPVQMEIANYVGTSCSNGAGLTTYWNSYLGYKYAQRLGHGYSCSYFWNIFGYHWKIRNIGVEGIMNYNAPVLLGTVDHMWTGYGYRRDLNTGWDDVEFYVYRGWRVNDFSNEYKWMSWREFKLGIKMDVYPK